MSADDLKKGVDGAGDTWKEEVDTDQAQSNYEGGATSQAAEDYEDNASGSQSAFEEGLAEYLNVDEDDISIGSSWSSAVGEAGGEWSDGVGESGAKWRRGVQRTDADTWEENTKAKASEWFSEFKDGAT